MKLGRFLWKRGDGTVIDGWDRTALPRACWMRRAGQFACRPVMSITMPWRCCWGWWRWPPGSWFREQSCEPSHSLLVTFVPLLGALAILLLPRANAARWIALAQPSSPSAYRC